jgi:hypothetical protein
VVRTARPTIYTLLSIHKIHNAWTNLRVVISPSGENFGLQRTATASVRLTGKNKVNYASK